MDLHTEEAEEDLEKELMLDDDDNETHSSRMRSLEPIQDRTQLGAIVFYVGCQYVIYIVNIAELHIFHSNGRYHSMQFKHGTLCHGIDARLSKH